MKAPTTEQIYKAAKASYDRHRDILINDEEPDYTYIDCALCQLFKPSARCITKSGCHGCPLAEEGYLCCKAVNTKDQTLLVQNLHKIVKEYEGKANSKSKSSKQPKTKVTVWDRNKVTDSCHRGNWHKSSYSFNGLPDVDRVIRETLDEGSLAVRIRCDSKFKPIVCHTNSIVFLINDIDFGVPARDDYHSYHDAEDDDIESAITKYLSEQPKYAVGDKVWWDGRVNASHKDVKPQEVTVSILHDNGNFGVDLQDGEYFGAFYDGLSPLPEMYVGKEWVMPTTYQYNDWAGYKVKCVDKRNNLEPFEQLVHPSGVHDGSYYPKGNKAIHDKEDHFIIHCIDPKFWTGEIEGEPVRVYKEPDNALRIVINDDYWRTYAYTNPCLCDRIWLAAIERANIPVMPNKMRKDLYGDDYPAPARKGK